MKIPFSRGGRIGRRTFPGGAGLAFGTCFGGHHQRPDIASQQFDELMRTGEVARDAGHDYDIRFVPEPVCWTEVPATIGGLQRQRRRWQRGALETIAAHWRMMLNPRYGRVGMLAFLHHLVVDVVGPSLEVLGYVLIPMMYLLDILSVDYLLAFTALTFVFGIAISVASLLLEELELRRYPAGRDLLKLAAVSVIENLGYRQLNTVWRFLGTIDHLRGTRGWGTAGCRGFRNT